MVITSVEYADAYVGSLPAGRAMSLIIIHDHASGCPTRTPLEFTGWLRPARNTGGILDG